MPAVRTKICSLRVTNFYNMKCERLAVITEMDNMRDPDTYIVRVLLDQTNRTIPGLVDGRLVVGTGLTFHSGRDQEHQTQLFPPSVRPEPVHLVGDQLTYYVVVNNAQLAVTLRASCGIMAGRLLGSIQTVYDNQHQAPTPATPNYLEIIHNILAGALNCLTPHVVPLRAALPPPGGMSPPPPGGMPPPPPRRPRRRNANYTGRGIRRLGQGVGRKRGSTSRGGK